MKRNLYIVLFVLLLIACQKEDIMEFSSDDTTVYFQGGGGYSMPANGTVIYAPTYHYVDSTVLSFAGYPSAERTRIAFVPIKTMGKIKNYPRPVKVVVDKEESSAIEGVDFTVGLDTLAIPANADGVRMPVILMRSDELLEKSKRIVFRLEENEHFKLLIQSYKASSNWAASADTLNALKYTIVFNEQYNMPFYWEFFGDDFFGPWTPKKYQVLNGVMGWTVRDWNNAGGTGSKVSFGRFDFAAKAMRRHLQEMADADTPIKDVDGSYMQLAPKYAVDYSKYEK